MRLVEISQSLNKQPRRFATGEDFMEYVYATWRDRNTHVEHQGGGAWLATIEGDPTIKLATYDEMSKNVEWCDQEGIPLEGV